MKNIYIALLILLLSSCVSVKKESIVLKQSSFSSLSGWKNDKLEDVEKSFESSCKYFFQKSKHHPIVIAGKYKAGKAGDWQDICGKISGLKGSKLHNFIENNFIPYRVISSKGSTGIFTGYYEPDIDASLHKTPHYSYPIYRYPDDRVTGIPYFTRHEIETGHLDGKDLELFYARDKVDLFFLHIQGSGILNFKDGKRLRISYAGHNGHSYTGIGRVMVEKKHIKKNDMSAEALKKWLRHNPEHADDIMRSNASYVFFKVNDNQEAAIGSLGVPLTPERSIAVDSSLMPMGFPVWLETKLPDVIPYRKATYNRLFFAQDIGGAIKGGIRGDIFFGNRKISEKLASYMYAKGQYYIIVPKSVEIK